MISKLPTDHFGRKARCCQICGEFKEPEDFDVFKHPRMACGYQAYNTCKECEKTRKLKNHLLNTYGLKWEDYLDMVEEQDGKCYLCDRPPTDVYGRLVVDHCHKTGKVRKLLCRVCNVRIAKLEDDSDYLQRVLNYIAT